MANLIFSFETSSQSGGGSPGGGSPPGVDGDAPFATSTSRTVATQSVTFSSAIEHGVYANGYDNNMWMKPGTITAYTPAYSSTVRGGNPGNGAMLNPGWNSGLSNSTSSRQGFSYRGSGPPLHIEYDNNARDSVPIAMTPGDCLVICHSRSQSITSGAGGYSVHRFLFVHCVADRPYADSFAPPYIWPASAGDKPLYRYSDIDLSKLPSVDTSGFSNAIPSPGDLLPSSEGFPHLRILDNIPYTYRENMKQTDGDHQGWCNTYSHSGLQEVVDPILAYICTDASNADKEEPLKYMMQRAIDTYGNIRNARDIGERPYNSDGGWNSCRVAPVIVGGHLLGDDTMRDFIGQNYRGDRHENSEFLGEYHMRTYMTGSAVNASQEPGWDGNSQGSGSLVPYQDAQAQAPAMPEWVGRLGGSGIPSGQINNTWDGNNPNFYRNVGHANGSSGEAAALELMGLRAALDHDAWLDYQARDYAIRHYGDDPWRYVNGNSSPRYSYIDDGPNGSGGSTVNFRRELYGRAVFDGFTYPAGVNAFNP